MLAQSGDTVPSFPVSFPWFFIVASLAGEDDVRQVVHTFRAAGTARPLHTGEIPL